MTSLHLLLDLLCISSVMGYLDYIVKGTPTDIENYPFQVSFKGIRSNKHLCAGAIITEKFIITAAHCIKNKNKFVINGEYQQYIFVGSTSISGEGQTHNIENAMFHPKFNRKDKLYDIGIVAIQDKFIFNKYVQPAKILSSDIPVGTTITATGWGRTSYPKITYSDTLQEIHMSVISVEECKAAFKKKRKVLNDSQICIYKPGHYGTCIGDSGGPVSLKGVLVGVVSWGKPCARGKPDVNTKLSAYVNWIITNITSYCKTKNCPCPNFLPIFVTYNEITFSPNMSYEY